MIQLDTQRALNHPTQVFNVSKKLTLRVRRHYVLMYSTHTVNAPLLSTHTSYEMETRMSWKTLACDAGFYTTCILGIGSESPYYNGIKRMLRDGCAGIPNLSHILV